MRKMRDQPRTTREELVNDLKAVGSTVTKQTIGNTIRLHGLKSFSAARLPLLKKTHVQTRLRFANEQRKIGINCCGQMRPKLSSLSSTRLAVFGGRKMLTMTLRTPQSLQSSTEVETLCFGAVSLLKVQIDFAALRGQWMRPCVVKFWMRTS